MKPTQPIVWPQLQRFKSIPELQARAEELYPDRPKLQEKWVDSIVYLRNNVKGGWRGDLAVVVKESAQPTRVAARAMK
jgi:hypothetical protein